ncbi:hypothetical protein GE061_012385 [Apolygus lucorum]|uniref:N-glycosylase/DNA lyase n=1 Tax=Apolygus lucorum TaxID=248454 RepID=A0A6A4JTX1_APOLU|nr:hypothetical protein GE061_012385 [Apolygus lucorum]
MSVSGKINIARKSLNLKLMLEGGQCFRWTKQSENKWIGVASKILWVITQREDHIEYLARSNKKITRSTCQEFLKKYLRLDEDLESLYEKWSTADEHFANLAVESPGLRMLSQEPVENIFSFICSSNNNIKRISSMVEKMCGLYGEKVFEDDKTSFHAFPSLERLAGEDVESALRVAGFGYRAKFIPKSAKRLIELGGEGWLNELSTLPYEEAKLGLMKLDGVGPKVADCILLMSLGHLSAVPVDTHVFQLAAKYYLPRSKSNAQSQKKGLSPKLYAEIQSRFLDIFGTYAGWAQTVLFCAELKMFQKEDKCEVESSNKSTQRAPKRSGEDIAKTVTNGFGASDNNENTKIKGKRLKNNDKSLDVSEKTGKIDEHLKRRTRGVHSVSGSVLVKKEDLNLLITFNSGQSYRWNQIGKDAWRGVFQHRLWTLHQLDDRLEFEATWNPEKIKTEENDVLNCQIILADYFRLDFDLQKYYSIWSNADDHFARIAKDFHGLRMIKQDPLENTIAFICSSNNTIARMRTMVEFLCSEYGDVVCADRDHQFYDFPTLNVLAAEKNLEEKLVAANFGFRAKYVAGSIAYISSRGGNAWFDQLVQCSYHEATAMLMELPGVGRKVADCICLTSLDHLNTVPVDTYVYQVASRYYLPHLREKKTITKKAYDEIDETFAKIFGDYCGWAHTVLFCSDLQQHANLRSESPKIDKNSRNVRSKYFS